MVVGQGIDDTMGNMLTAANTWLIVRIIVCLWYLCAFILLFGGILSGIGGCIGLIVTS